MTGYGVHVYDASSVANFTDWGLFISTALSTAGWTQTSDTGQVNWSTIGSVPGSNAYVYELWHPTDGLQSTNPYVIKVQYGNSGGTNNPNVRITVGTGSDGSGNITGSAIVGPMSVFQGTPIAGTGAPTFDCYWSGDTGRFGVMMWRNASSVNIPMFFGLERTLDASGTAISDGVTILTVGGTQSNGWTRQQTLTLVPSIAAGLIYNSPLVLGVPDIGFGTVGVYSNVLGINVAISMVFPCYGKFGNPMTIAGSAGISDVTENVTFTTSLYSATRTLLPTFGGNGFSSFASGLVNTGRKAFLMRYD